MTAMGSTIQFAQVFFSTEIQRKTKIHGCTLQQRPVSVTLSAVCTVCISLCALCNCAWILHSGVEIICVCMCVMWSHMFSVISPFSGSEKIFLFLNKLKVFLLFFLSHCPLPSLSSDYKWRQCLLNEFLTQPLRRWSFVHLKMYIFSKQQAFKILLFLF